MINSTLGNYKVWMIDILSEMIVAAAHALDHENYWVCMNIVCV
jgi:hypothetical protein